LQVQTAALSILGRDSAVVEDDAELRAALPSLLPVKIEQPDSTNAQFELAVHPLLARLAAFHASNAVGGSREAGRQLLAAWMARLRDDLSRTIWNSYVYDLASLRAYSVATYAARFSSMEEVKALFGDMAALDPKLPHHDWAAKAAKRAQAVLEATRN
jgi:hypothetical protein